MDYVAKFFLWIVGIIIGLIIFFTILTAISDYYEVQAFNRIHGTDYSWGEWFWAGSTLKEYQLGEVKNYNINIEGLEGLSNG